MSPQSHGVNVIAAGSDSFDVQSHESRRKSSSEETIRERIGASSRRDEHPALSAAVSQLVKLPLRARSASIKAISSAPDRTTLLSGSKSSSLLRSS
jgi:hypothetical protein